MGYTTAMQREKWTVPVAIMLSLVLVGLAFVYRAGSTTPRGAVALPAGQAGVRDGTGDIAWEEIERKLINTGVIDEAQWAGARTKLNLLWAFGLANENRILMEGPMMDPRYGGLPTGQAGAGRFASTGGWTLARQNLDGQNLGGQARGSAMDHYAMHRFVTLTDDQQKLVERVSKNIYRPCCGNPVYFPDCNHGMAMLGFLTLRAAAGATENELYREALALNTEWFPDTYDAIGRYFEKRGVARENIDPKVALGPEFSSSEGYARVLAEVEPLPSQGGGSCGV